MNKNIDKSINTKPEWEKVMDNIQKYGFKPVPEVEYLRIPIKEKELHTKYKLGEEITYEDDINLRIYKGVIVNIVHESCEPNLDLIIKITESTRIKSISIEALNKIKMCDLRIFEAQDDDPPNLRQVRANERALDNYLINYTQEEQRELLSNIKWQDDNCKERLEKLGWVIKNDNY